MATTGLDRSLKRNASREAEDAAAAKEGRKEGEDEISDMETDEKEMEEAPKWAVKMSKDMGVLLKKMVGVDSKINGAIQTATEAKQRAETATEARVRLTPDSSKIIIVLVGLDEDE